jgi:transposase-like protein
MKRKSSKRTRRTFSKEEKLAAIQRLENGEPSELKPDLVRRWREEWHKYGANAFSGCGTPRAETPQKTEAVVFRLTHGENERLLACLQSSGARTLSEFARRQLFEPQPEPEQIERKVAELTGVVEDLTRRIAGA